MSCFKTFVTSVIQEEKAIEFLVQSTAGKLLPDFTTTFSCLTAKEQNSSIYILYKFLKFFRIFIKNPSDVCRAQKRQSCIVKCYNLMEQYFKMYLSHNTFLQC